MLTTLVSVAACSNPQENTASGDSHPMSQTSHSPPQIPSSEDLAQLPPDGGEQWNRLVFEQSPYLLQHAANPVDWFPWGEEAFEKARQEDKPVFLSVGYATCHWCHVMERESFEDPEVAGLMNDTFICIKVDREERPDIDHVYMTVTQALTGSGGWPMTVLMTSDKKPFFAGTYFPKQGRYGRPGMMDLIPQIHRLWAEDRDRLLQSAEEVSSELKKISGNFPGDALTTETVNKAVQSFKARFDDEYGGFGGHPKFPVPHNLMFLLRVYHRTHDPEVLEMVEKTLSGMRMGGIYDHVGFGFHRYSTDSQWLVPHFEKMLYDQALLAMAYTEAWQVTQSAQYQQTVEEVLYYVSRDMTAPEGGFYCAEDADSEGVEGKFYVWSSDEVEKILGENSDIFMSFYGIKEEGNFRDESTGELTGANIPHLGKSMKELARETNKEPKELAQLLEKQRAILFELREQRVHPLKDDKILTDWNGLMIAAYAKAGMAFGKEEYLQVAERATQFAIQHLRTEEGRLLKRYRNGSAGLPAHLEDYAYLAWGVFELYEATLKEEYLLLCKELVERMIADFWDQEHHGFFLTAHDGEKLLVRSKEIYDGARPSGNSVATMLLARMGRLTGNSEWEEMAAQVFMAFSQAVEHGPSNHAMMLMALEFLQEPSMEIVFTGKEPGEMISVVQQGFLPQAVWTYRSEDSSEEFLQAIPSLSSFAGTDNQAFICRNYACERPVQDVPSLTRKLFTNEK